MLGYCSLVGRQPLYLCSMTVNVLLSDATAQDVGKPVAAAASKGPQSSLAWLTEAQDSP